MLADSRHFSHCRDDASTEVVGMRTGEAQPLHTRHGADVPQQVSEIVRAVVVRIHRLAQQHHLAHAFCHHVRGFAHHVMQLAAALGAARGGDDAIGAAIIAAALHRDPCLDLVEPPRREVLVVLLEVERGGDGLAPSPRTVDELRQRAIAVRADDE